MIDVLPPGPAPMPGVEQHAIDLGIRWRDATLTRAHLAGPVRQGWATALRAALSTADRGAAASALRAFLDTWPLAATVDAARAAWSRRDATGLAVLARAAALVGTPTDEWIRAQAGAGPWRVLTRCPGDGADAVAAALGTEVAGSAPLPGWVAVPGGALAARRAELGRALATGALDAVLVEEPVPTDPATTLALGEVRLEGRRQLAVERFGLAGLFATDVPELAFGPAPAGQAGATALCCAWITCPGTPGDLARGEVRPVLYLVWDGPYAPLAVTTEAAPVLAAVARGEPVHGPLVDELTRLGALTGPDAP